MTWSSLRFNVWRSSAAMATNLPSCLLIQFLEQLLKFLLNFTLLKYVKYQSSKLWLFNHKRSDCLASTFFFSLFSLLKRAKDHGKNYIIVKRFLVCHLLRNRLLILLSISLFSSCLPLLFLDAFRMDAMSHCIGIVFSTKTKMHAIMVLRLAL